MQISSILEYITLVTAVSAIVISLWRFVFKRGADDQARKNEIEKRDGEKKTTDDSIKRLQDSIDKLTKKVEDIDTCAKSTATKIEPFWGLIMTNLPSLLSVTHSENLLNKLSDDRITDEELEHLEKEVQILLAQAKAVNGPVFVDLIALWAIQVKKNERMNTKTTCTTNTQPHGGVVV